MIAEVQLERLRASCNALRSGVADSSFAEDFYACLCPAAEAGPATEMDAKATADAVAAALQAVDVNAKEESVGNNICSVLWLLGTQTVPGSPQRIGLCALVKSLADKKIVDPSLLLSSLEFSLLVGAGLVKDEVALQRRLIKLNTGLVYRQQKYNLLREELEGYARLAVVLAKMPPSRGDSNIDQYITNVLSLVGSFDLDPNRVLDVILDCFEEQPLNLSFVLLLGTFRRANILHILGFKYTLYTNKEVPATESKESVGTGAKENTTVVKRVQAACAPFTLHLITAMLLTNGVVTLDELLPYFANTAQDTASKAAVKEKSIESEVKSFGVINLKVTPSTKAVETKADRAPLPNELAPKITVAPLLGGTKPPPPMYPPPETTKSIPGGSLLANALQKVTSSPAIAGADGEVKQSVFALLGEENASFVSTDENDSEADHLIGIATALLCLRNWSMARHILEDLHSLGCNTLLYSPRTAAALAGLLEWYTEELYNPLAYTKLQLTSSESYRGGSSITSLQNVNSSTDFSEYCYYLVRRAPLPVATSPFPILNQLKDLTQLSEALQPMSQLLGYHLSKQPRLFVRICRLLRSYLDSQKDKASSAGHLDEGVSNKYSSVALLLSEVMLPALTMSYFNPFLGSQLWAAIRIIPFEVRFHIYDEWRGAGLGKEALNSKPPEVALAETRALHGVRAELKRLAKENMKVVGRKLSRFTNNSPLVVFNYVLTQIESFDNLIPFVVEALKYCTDLARDVMAYSLIVQLKKDSGKLKKGDTHYSQWFASLAKFTATFYRRYPNTEIKGLLHFLLKRLSSGESLDLLVLKELLAVMGGSETLLEVSAVQLEGLSGGRLLRNEVMIGGAASKETASKKAMRLLREELMNSGTAMPLLLLIAQIRSYVLYDRETPQLRLVSHLFDTAQDVLMQFTEFLVAGSKSVEHMARIMPSLQSLVEEMELSLPIAFQLVRPLLRAALQHSFMCGDQQMVVNGQSDKIASSLPEYLQRWYPFNDDIVLLVSQHAFSKRISEQDSGEDILDGSALDKNCGLNRNLLDGVVSPRLYLTFWSLSLYDISVPTRRYEAEINRLRDRYSELDQKTVSSMALKGIKMTSSEADKFNRQKKTDLAKLLTTITELSDENASQQRHMEQVKSLMMQDKDSYFSNLSPEQRALVADSLLQHLVYDRVLLSPIDAIYCSQFLLLLHDLQTPSLSTLQLVDRLLVTLAPILFSTTETEASFLGYAVGDLLQQLNKWFQEPEAFSIQANLLADSSLLKSGGATNSTQKLSHEDFRGICKDWHTALFEVLMSCLSSSEYMYLRCALVFLSKVAMQFPNRVCEGHELLQQVEIVKEREKDRPGLQTMALSLSTILRRQAPQWFNDDSEGKYANSISKKASTGAAVASLENNFDEQKFKNTSENREGKGSVESRESKGSREIKDSRDSKDQRPPVHPHQQSNPKEARDSKDKDKAVSRNSNKDTEKEIAAKGGKDTKDSSSKYSSRGVASRKEEVKANDNGRNESDIKGRDRRDEKGTTSTGSRNGRVDDKNAKDTATSSRESPHNKERTSDRVTDSSRENQSDRDGGLRKSKDESYDDNRERDSRRQESKQTDQYKKTADNRSVDGGRQSSRHSRDRSRDNQDDQRNKLSDLESTDLVGQQSKDNQKRKRTDSSDRPEKSSRNSGKNENSVPETKKGYNSSSEGGKNSRGRTDEHGNADEQRNKRDHQTMEGPLPVAVELQRDDLKSKKARREDDIASTEKAATKDVEQEPTKVVNESTDDKGKSAETQHSSKDRKEGEKKSSHKSKHKEGRKHEKGKGEDNIEPPKKNPFVNSQLSLPVETRTDNRANIPPVVLATAPLLTDYSGKNGAGLNRTSTHTPGGRSHGGGRGATPLQQQPSVPPPSYGSKSQAGMSAAGIQPSLPSQQYYAPQGSGNYHGQYSQGGRHSQQNYQGRGGRGGRGRGSR